MKYPWHKWTNGAWHRVAAEDVPKRFDGQVRYYASRHNLECGTIRKGNGDLVFRLGKEIDLENKTIIGADGQVQPFFAPHPEEAEEPVWNDV